MRTAKQIAASRANGAKSTGANTPEGKARIVAANLKSGVYAAYESVEWEDAGQLEELRLEYYARHAPATPEARCLVDELVMCEWSLRRFRRVDTSLFEYGALTRASNDSDENVAVGFASFDKTFQRLQYRFNSTRAAFHRALAKLEELEAQYEPVGDESDDSASPSPETQLHDLGSLRSSTPDDPGRAA